MAFSVLFFLSAAGFLRQMAVAGLPTADLARLHNATGGSNGSLPPPAQSRIGRTFKNLCTDTRKFCSCVTADTGLTGHEYAVVDLGGQPTNWEVLMEECILEGMVNLGDGLTYRLAVIENMKENNCLTTWLADKYANLGAREFAIGLKVAQPIDPSSGTGVLAKMYNVWEWAGISTKVTAVAPSFSPPWNWEGGRGGGDCATLIVANHDQNGFWRRRGCSNEPVYGICERYKAV